nr:Chain C, NP418 epitope from 1977 influenza strain [synthetic construct]
LPFDKTTIM